jgi:CRP-like cAMP-binding protein
MLARTYEENDIICAKGDKGDCMYVIFEGSVEVVGKNKKMGPNSILGRNALDTDLPRNATLKALCLTHLLLLSRIDYITILGNIMKLESVK